MPIFNLCRELYAGELYVRFSKIVKQEFSATPLLALGKT